MTPDDGDGEPPADGDAPPSRDDDEDPAGDGDAGDSPGRDASGEPPADGPDESAPSSTGDAPPGGDETPDSGAAAGDDGPPGDDPAPEDGRTPPPGGPDRDASDAALTAEIEELREDLNDFRDDVEDRTLHRDDVEADLRKYVRRRLRRGHARGWGPYVVLLYGTLMTLGAFYYLENFTAVLAMVVVWLSTLGLYVLMVLFGVVFEVLGLPGRAVDYVRDR